MGVEFQHCPINQDRIRTNKCRNRKTHTVKIRMRRREISTSIACFQDQVDIGRMEGNKYHNDQMGTLMNVVLTSW